jgi:hypothetical protein
MIRTGGVWAMRSKIFTILIIALLTLGVSFSASTVLVASAESRHNLTISIIDQSEQIPIANANVTIIGPENSSRITDSAGIVIFKGIMEGNYHVVTVAPGYPLSSTQTIPKLTSDLSLTVWYSFTKAFFIFSPSRPTTTQRIFFDATESNSSGIIESYTWDFGDKTAGYNQTTSHTYTKPGEYYVTLNVKSSVGAAKYSQLVIVNSNDKVFPDYLIIILLAALFLVPLLLFFLLRRRHYYVVIQTRIPPDRKHLHCPGDDSDCDNCKLTPC